MSFSVCLSVCPVKFVYSFVCSFTHFRVCSSVFLFGCLFIHPSVRASMCPSISPPTTPSIRERPSAITSFVCLFIRACFCRLADEDVLSSVITCSVTASLFLQKKIQSGYNENDEVQQYLGTARNR